MQQKVELQLSLWTTYSPDDEKDWLTINFN